MDRRTALKNISLLLGGTIISSQAFLTSCVFDKDGSAHQDSFSQEEVSLMNQIGEVIIPTTDTPGAKAANVGQFMAVMLEEAYQEKQKWAVKDGLKTIQADFRSAYGHSFGDGTSSEQAAFIEELENKASDYYEAKNPEDADYYYYLIKELTLLGYFTSEIGATKALNYVQTPGRYEACVPYQQGEKAWL